MHIKLGTWPKTLWKMVTNPVVEVAIAIALVLLAAWIVVLTDVEMRKAHPFAMPFAHPHGHVPR